MKIKTSLLLSTLSAITVIGCSSTNIPTAVVPVQHAAIVSTLTCDAMTLCDAPLKAGESVISVSAADTQQWNIAIAYSGTGSQLMPHLVIKPTEPNLKTNAIVYTNAGFYIYYLVSPAKNR